MDVAALDLLTVTTGAQHEIIAWFDTDDGTRYAARCINPPDTAKAREWLMKGSQATRRLLYNRKAPYVPEDGPLFCATHPGCQTVVIWKIGGTYEDTMAENPRWKP